MRDQNRTYLAIIPVQVGRFIPECEGVQSQTVAFDLKFEGEGT
jgi:hypothetical protein